MIERQHLETYQDLFCHQCSLNAQQTAKGAYFVKRELVDPEVISQHLRGEITAGWYALRSDNTVRWVALDADRQDDLEQLQLAWKQLDRLTGQQELHRLGTASAG